MDAELLRVLTQQGTGRAYYSLSSQAPLNPSVGMMWYQTDTGQLVVWNGATWQGFFPQMSGASAGIGGSGTTLGTNSSKLPLSTLVYSYGLGTFDNVTNYRYTAGVTGYYRVDAFMQFQMTVAAEAAYFSIYKNGSQYSTATSLFRGQSGSQTNSVMICDIVHLSTSDYIEMWASASTASTLASRVQFNITLVARG